MSPAQARISRLVQRANGSSQPWFCTLDDETLWLVKFAGAGPGREALLAEYIANSLARMWGLPVPEAKPVFLDSSVTRAGTDEFWDVLSASAGWNLAIRTIPGAADVIPSSELPQASLESMVAFDRLLVNWDRTAISRNLLRDRAGQLWWIDHGSCRFLHRLETQERPQLPATHFLFDVRELIEPRSLPIPALSAIREVLAVVPDEWLRAGAHERSRLANDLFAYLRRSLS